MRILVGGSLEDVPRDPELCREFVAALGREIVKRGHVLLNGCRGSVDKEVATAAQEWLGKNGGNPDKSIISYCTNINAPVHRIGRVRQSSLPDWQMNHPELRVPEQIEQADATIFIAGHDGTFLAKNWAFYARKPILGVPRFGGAGETIYDQELARFRTNSPATAEDYETLNQVSTDVSHYVAEVVTLAERLVTPRSVFTIMSFEKEFRDVYASCKEVCKEFGLEAERTDETGSLERIIPRIEKGIRGSAFVIADVSAATPNVFYEVGFARGLGKELIMTAKKGTKLPFDVGDIPAIFWEIQEDLKEGLRKSIGDLRGKFHR
jgi:predicted Rossmann-fold nucleotide-binding protein